MRNKPDESSFWGSRMIRKVLLIVTITNPE